MLIKVKRILRIRGRGFGSFWVVVLLVTGGWGVIGRGGIFGSVWIFFIGYYWYRFSCDNKNVFIFVKGV